MNFDKEFLINLVANLLQIDSKELSGTLEAAETNEDLQEILTAKAQDRIKEIRKNAKDMAYGRAKREEYSAAEKLIKEKLGIDKGDTLEDMLESYLANQGSNQDKPSKKNDLTLDDMLKHEAMQNHIAKFRKQIEELTNAVQQEKQARQQDQFNYGFEGQLRNALNAINADLGEGEQAKTRFEMYKMYLTNKHKFNKDYAPIDENGDPLFSENGYDPLQLTDLVKKTWTFGVKESKQQNNTRTPNPNENSFNKSQFGLKEDELKDGKLLYQKYNEAKAAGNKEAAEQYKKLLMESAK